MLCTAFFNFYAGSEESVITIKTDSLFYFVLVSPNRLTIVRAVTNNISYIRDERRLKA